MYHPRKANVMMDALSRKTVHMLALMVKELELVEKFRDIDLYVVGSRYHISYGMIMVTSCFMETMKEKTKELLGINRVKYFNSVEDSILRYKGRICVPQNPKLRRLILEEGHKSRLSLHPRMKKMYQDLKMFWWSGMKAEVAKYWKWDSIAMDFVVCLPRMVKGFDSTWAIVDRLTQYAHILPINIKYSLEKLR
ncbi:hypothetical protein CR513_55061, partial [Mucuna pruriens]